MRGPGRVPHGEGRKSVYYLTPASLLQLEVVSRQPVRDLTAHPSLAGACVVQMMANAVLFRPSLFSQKAKSLYTQKGEMAYLLLLVE